MVPTCLIIQERLQLLTTKTRHRANYPKGVERVPTWHIPDFRNIHASSHVVQVHSDGVEYK